MLPVHIVHVLPLKAVGIDGLKAQKELFAKQFRNVTNEPSISQPMKYGRLKEINCMAIICASSFPKSNVPGKRRVHIKQWY